MEFKGAFVGVFWKNFKKICEKIKTAPQKVQVNKVIYTDLSDALCYL